MYAYQFILVLTKLMQNDLLKQVYDEMQSLLKVAFFQFNLISFYVVIKYVCMLITKRRTL